MKTGIELIAIERQEQKEKHGYDVTNPANEEFYHPYKLVEAAMFSLTRNDEYYPKKWGNTWKDKMNIKDATLQHPERYLQRLIIAGALLAAEIDRIQSQQQ